MPSSLENIFADTPVHGLPSPAPDISLWLCLLDRPPPEVEALAQTLSQQEHARAARFGTDLLRRRWIAGRATLRRVLGRSLGIEPHAVALQRGVRGRPEIAGMRDIDFNISHTEGIALMGIARLRHP